MAPAPCEIGAGQMNRTASANGQAASSSSTWVIKLRAVSITPLGFPVVPPV